MGSDERFAVMLAANGHLMVGAGGLFCLYAMQALTMNMFGSDRSGLTLQFLSPIADRDLARGKVAGCGMIFGVGLALAVGSALLVAANSPPSLWIAVVLGVVATYILLSPLFVWLSAPVSRRVGSQQDRQRRQSASAADVHRHRARAVRGAAGSRDYRAGPVLARASRVWRRS